MDLISIVTVASLLLVSSVTVYVNKLLKANEKTKNLQISEQLEDAFTVLVREAIMYAFQLNNKTPVESTEEKDALNAKKLSDAVSYVLNKVGTQYTYSEIRAKIEATFPVVKKQFNTPNPYAIYKPSDTL